MEGFLLGTTFGHPQERGGNTRMALGQHFQQWIWGSTSFPSCQQVMLCILMLKGIKGSQPGPVCLVGSLAQVV